ncbi:hypothetical protein [Actinoplanes sp. NPDC049316]|uniref:hypothetical protein n=1 Tax=Actinoplanes sp. NPDC049316 TaxID=3154727 RepID=UPI00341B5623
MSNLDAIAGFAVNEQLGLALGVPAVVEVTLPIAPQDPRTNFRCRNTFRAMAPSAVLRGKDC